MVTEEQSFRTIELAKFTLALQTQTLNVRGPFASRTPGLIPGVSGVDNMSPEQLKTKLDKIASLYQTIIGLMMTEDPIKQKSAT